MTTYNNPHNNYYRDDRFDETLAGYRLVNAAPAAPKSHATESIVTRSSTD